jgi:HD-GYP domain-containing protein (c-di-GMP phosphodiesterase class II)
MRAATFLCMFGQSIGVSGQDLKTLTTGGLLLDVGKSYIPYELLNKLGPLAPGEYNIIKDHVMYGVSFLNQIKGLPKGVSVIAEQHHEKIDGTGYPNNLTGIELNNLARMAAIVDVFCALTDRRTYKQAMEPDKALATMFAMEGHLDHRLLQFFSKSLQDVPSIH